MIDNISHVSCLKNFLVNAFALSVLIPYSPLLLSGFTDCIVSCFLAWKRKLIFHITCREFTYFHILKIRITFVVQEFWRSVYMFLAIHWAHSERRLIRLSFSPGWSESLPGTQVSLLVLPHKGPLKSGLLIQVVSEFTLECWKHW